MNHKENPTDILHLTRCEIFMRIYLVIRNKAETRTALERDQNQTHNHFRQFEKQEFILWIPVFDSNIHFNWKSHI